MKSEFQIKFKQWKDKSKKAKKNNKRTKNKMGKILLFEKKEMTYISLNKKQLKLKMKSLTMKRMN